MKNIKIAFDYIKIYNILPVVICFFFGRVRLFGFFSPFAYAACACFGPGLGAVCGVASLLGMASRGLNLYICKYFFIFVCFLLVNPLVSKKFPKRDFSVGLVPLGAVALGGGIFGIFYGFSAYYLFVNTVEALFSFFVSYVLDRGFGLIDPRRPKRLITTEEVISLIVIAGVVICGTEDIIIFGAEVSVILAALFLLTVSYKFGSAAGACCGSCLAFMLIMQGGGELSLFPPLSLSGFLTGFVKGKNRGLAAFIFVVGLFLLTLKFDSSLLERSYVSGAVFSSTLFLFIPDRIYYRLSSVFNTGVREPEEYIEQVYTMVENTLKSYSFSFRSLGAAFTDYREKEQQENIYNRMTDEAARRMCLGCSLKSFCWDKNYYVTYDAICKMFINMEENGYIDLSRISYDFKRSCMAFSTFVQTAEKVWETEHLNIVWLNRPRKTRAVMKCYIESVAELLFNLSFSFRSDLSFDKEMSLKLLNCLKDERINVKSLSAGRTAGGRLEILVTMRNCDCTKLNTDRIIEVINDNSTEKIMKEGGIAVYDKYNKDLCTIRFIGKNRLHVGVKIFKEPKSGKRVSGDNHTFTKLKDGTYLLALSDGMGSGKAASEKSAASLDLFREFISSGFSKEASIRLINTCLEINASEESFATLDACIINLYSGDTSIIKTAACPTYILRNGKVTEIKGESLPMGILTEISPQISEYKLKKNDTVIMVTDGAADSFKAEGRALGGLINTIEEYATLSYPRLCETLFEVVKHNYRGLILDDITVLVAKIY
ncbi:MAG: SpoIIE family protein phosphatase [Clostridiales bacterium]|nr:SpoIIE family protein phosphatase [Clostridiales bacterium]